MHSAPFLLPRLLGLAKSSGDPECILWPAVPAGGVSCFVWSPKGTEKYGGVATKEGGRGAAAHSWYRDHGRGNMNLLYLLT